MYINVQDNKYKYNNTNTIPYIQPPINLPADTFLPVESVLLREISHDLHSLSGAGSSLQCDLRQLGRLQQCAAAVHTHGGGEQLACAGALANAHLVLIHDACMCMCIYMC